MVVPTLDHCLFQERYIVGDGVLSTHISSIGALSGVCAAEIGTSVASVVVADATIVACSRRGEDTAANGKQKIE